MAANFSKPVITDNYTSVLTDLRDKDTALAVMQDPALVTPTNTPNGAVRWNSAFNSGKGRFEKFNGTTWDALSVNYSINIDGSATTASSVTGLNVVSGKTLTANNSITLSGTDGTSFTLPASSGTLALNNQNTYIGTTPIALNRGSAVQTLTGVNIDGNAASATNAVNAANAPTASANLVRATDIQSQAVTKFTTSGTSTAFTGAPNPPITSNAAGQRFTATLHAAPTGPFTLSVSGQPAMNVIYFDTNLGSWQIAGAAHAKQWYRCDVVSEGGNWILLNPIPTKTALMAVPPTGYNTSVTLTAADMNKLLYYYGSGAGTFTLPAAPAVGDTATISAINAGTCTIARSGSQLIYARGVGGATSTSIALGESISLLFDGANWVQAAGSFPQQPQDCKAWVFFNGVGTVQILASKNVSSITDNGTGDYTVNFITPMVDANYAVAKSLLSSSLASWGMYSHGEERSAWAVRCRGNRDTNGTLYDTEFNSVTVFR